MRHSTLLIPKKFNVSLSCIMISLFIKLIDSVNYICIEFNHLSIGFRVDVLCNRSEPFNLLH